MVSTNLHYSCGGQETDVLVEVCFLELCVHPLVLEADVTVEV